MGPKQVGCTCRVWLSTELLLVQPRASLGSLSVTALLSTRACNQPHTSVSTAHASTASIIYSFRPTLMHLR